MHNAPDPPAAKSPRKLPLYSAPRGQSRLSGETSATTQGSSSRGSSTDLFLLAAYRLGYGPSPTQRQDWDNMPGSDEVRLNDYIDEQLDPDSISDSAFESMRSGLYSTLNKSLNQLWEEHERNGDYSTRILPAEESRNEWILRAVFSNRQLLHRMTEFWSDHFNVYIHDDDAESVWPHWIRTLRGETTDAYMASLPNAGCFGNFRELLEATAKHTAMLYYLDQYVSNGVNPNENYLREAFELHSMGAAHYLGADVLPNAIDDSTVWTAYFDDIGYTTLAAELAADDPRFAAHVFPFTRAPFPNGIPDGYVDADVLAAAKVFVGYTYRRSSSSPPPSDNGEFYFDEGDHPNSLDVSVMNFLTLNIVSGLGEAQRAQRILDMLAYHPATAVHICTKLIRRFVRDDVKDVTIDDLKNSVDPNSGLPGITALIKSSARIFLENRFEPNQLKLVMEEILKSDAFKDSFGLQMKRPYDVVTSMLRGTQASFDWAVGGDENSSFWWRFDDTGHEPFHWRPPDGYPDTRDKWEVASPRVMTWRLGQWMCSARNDAGDWFMPVDTLTPGSVPRTPNALVDYWIPRLLGRSSGDMNPAYREELVDFLAQGFNPNNLMNLGEETEQERLQMFMALIMATPEFCER